MTTIGRATPLCKAEAPAPSGDASRAAMLTLREVFFRLPFARSTTFRFLRAGVFKGATKINGRWMVPVADVEAFEARIKRTGGAA